MAPAQAPPRAGPAAFLGLLIPAALLAHASCSPAYVMHVWSGHRAVLSGRRPIRDILADPAAPADLKRKLSLVEEIRGFGVEAMGMPPSRSYTQYVELPRPYVTLNVTACRKTSFEPHEWWFPVIGKVPYKGFFSEAGARREAERMDRRGYDTLVGGVAAYSTLGWWQDPVLSTMLEGPAHVLAGMVLHEMSHGAVYFKGQGSFNESMATFLGEAGAEDFMRRKFGEGSPEWRGMRESETRAAARDRAVEEIHGELSALYASTAAASAKLGAREEIFGRYRLRLGLEEGAPLNNAVVLAHRRYHEDLGDFRAAHEGLGRDWPRTLAFLKSLDRKDPRRALRERLALPAR